MSQGSPRVCATARPRFADAVLFVVTAGELGYLLALTPEFTVVDWIYVVQHSIVLAVSFVRRPVRDKDYSLRTSVAVFVAYAYPYAQIAYLRTAPGDPAWPDAGLVLVALGACLSLASLVSLGRCFGVRPALRSLVQIGPYRFVRHPMYLAYLFADIGYNLQEWNAGTALLTAIGWASLVYRILAEERVMSQDAGWRDYAAQVRYHLVPGAW